MTIEQTGVVDYLGIEKGTGRVLLTIVDDLDWSDEKRHLLLLQEKLNRYLAFLESGEVYDHLRDRVGRPVSREAPIEVRVLAKHAPTELGERFYVQAERALRGAGFGLALKVLDVEASQDE